MALSGKKQKRKEVAQGRKAGMLPYGNGCGLHLNCFTCPLPDCVSHYGANRKEQNRLIRLEKPFFEHLDKVRSSICGGRKDED